MVNVEIIRLLASPHRDEQGAGGSIAAIGEQPHRSRKPREDAFARALLPMLLSMVTAWPAIFASLLWCALVLEVVLRSDMRRRSSGSSLHAIQIARLPFAAAPPLAMPTGGGRASEAPEEEAAEVAGRDLRRCLGDACARLLYPR